MHHNLNVETSWKFCSRGEINKKHISERVQAATEREHRHGHAHLLSRLQSAQTDIRLAHDGQSRGCLSRGGRYLGLSALQLGDHWVTEAIPHNHSQLHRHSDVSFARKARHTAQQLPSLPPHHGAEVTAASVNLSA